MKNLKILFPFLLMLGLFSFMPSDTVKTDTIKAPIEIHVKNVNQNPDAKQCFETINKLEAQKSIIQERIDSVFNVLDSIDQRTNTTTRHHKIVLFDRNGSKESPRSLLSERTEQTDNKQEGRSNYAFANSILTESSDTHEPNSHLDRKEQTSKVNNHKGDDNHSLIAHNIYNQINGKAELDVFGYSGNDTWSGNNIFCSILAGQSEKQNRLFGDTERTKCRIRQTAYSIGRKDKETLVFMVG